MRLVKRRSFGIAFLLVLVVGVSAYVYETAGISVTQTVKQIATLEVQNSALGNIEEGQTLFYTKVNMTTLGNILNCTTTKDSVYLHFDSDIQLMTTYYSNYTIAVKYAAVGSGSSHNVGDIACTMTIAAPDPAEVTLDKLGDWRFDFEITTTAISVTTDQPNTVTIVVTAD